jgi:uncharacterized protein YdhG (YjbR/CyaY superfamily)
MQAVNMKYETIDEYIANFPAEQQAVLQEIRATIKKAAPQATEKIGYGIPTFFLKGNLVHFAGFKNHYGFYPGPGAIIQFQQEFAAYEQSKGAVRFPMDKPVPLDLIRRVTEVRVRENLEKAAQKGKKGK